MNNLGFIETPYRKVTDGKIDLKETVYLTAEEEESKLIAQANIPFDEGGQITADKIIAREEADYPCSWPSR